MDSTQHRGARMRAIATKMAVGLYSEASLDPADVRRSLWVVHGRDEPLRQAVFGFLRQLDLRPLEWEQLVRATGAASPFDGDVAHQAPAQARAAVVILSPDDVVHLHPELHRSPEDSWEIAASCQPRPDALVQLGLALAAYPERTVILQVGDLRPIAVLAGRNIIRFDGSSISLGKVIERLKSAGCAVDDVGEDWRDTRPFAQLAAFRRHPLGVRAPF